MFKINEYQFTLLLVDLIHVQLTLYVHNYFLNSNLAISESKQIS